MDEVTSGALEQFGTEGIHRDRVRFIRYGKLRYENQEHTVENALPDGQIDAEAIGKIIESFHQAYEREYTYRLDAPVEFVGLHLVSFAAVGKLEPMKFPVCRKTLQDALKGHREVDYALEGVHTAAIYDGDALEPNMTLDGPAIIETSGTTMVIHPGNRVGIDEYGNVHISIEGATA